MDQPRYSAKRWEKIFKTQMERRAFERISMKSILRIFRYCRKRIIALSVENRVLKTQLEYYRAIIESDHNKKH